MFFKKRNTNNDLSWLQVDMHSHLLPGIDDGSPDMATSIELIKGLKQSGYKKIVTTPHVLWELFPNTTDIIQRKLEEVQKAIAEQKIDIEFRAAAEYFIDEHFTDELKRKIPLLPISSNKVLVEFSMVTAPIDLHEVLFEMQMQDYQPVIAHPERYAYLVRRKEVYDQLKDSGCMFQLNLLSLTGHYGEVVQTLADYLLKNNFYDFAGTDLHHHRHLSLLQKLPVSGLKRLQDTGLVKNHQL